MPKNSPPAAADVRRFDGGARRTVAAIAAAAERWKDADFPPRVRATARIADRTGYALPVVDYALDRLFEHLTKAALESAICDELGSFEALDAFVGREGRPDGLALPAGRVAVVASDTTIGVALTPALYALCAGCDVVVRDRSDALTSDFAQTLAEENPAVAARLNAVLAGRHDDPAWMDVLQNADVVVAFGTDEALSAIRAQTKPQARFVAFGHRTSATYVAHEALATIESATMLAERAAVDAILYDGEGCLSSHMLFVERGAPVDPAAFSELLFAALERTAVEFPPARSEPEPATIAYRDAAAFRSALGRGAVAWDARGLTLLVADPPRDDSPPLLPRTVAAYAVADPQEFVDFIARHALALEAVAVEPFPPRDDVASAIVQCRAARIARIGSLQTPSLAGEHGGERCIAPFVRWVTREQ